MARDEVSAKLTRTQAWIVVELLDKASASCEDARYNWQYSRAATRIRKSLQRNKESK